MTASAATRRPPVPRTPQRRGVIGGTLIGIFIGIVVGLGLASAVAYWLMKNNPALPLPSLARDVREPAHDATKTAKADADKPRFDFYKILPGVEEPKLPAKAAERPPTDKATVQRAAVPDKALAKVEEPADETRIESRTGIERAVGPEHPAQ